MLRATATKAEADAVYRAAIRAGLTPGDYMRSLLGLSVANKPASDGKPLTAT